MLKFTILARISEKKKPATAAKGGDVELLSATNRLLFAQLGPGGDGDVEIVKQLLSEQDVSLDSVNSKGRAACHLVFLN